MPNLSSDTLFHFTSSIDTLQKILKEGLRYGLFAEKFPDGKIAYFIRGISFCNIPLSMIGEHIAWYGKYAVGLKRTVLRAKGASPVFYVHSQTKSLPHGNSIVSILENNPFVCFIKQYYGKQYNKAIGDYRYKKFYDEKEWRVFDGIPVFEKYTTVSELDDIRKEKDRVIPEIKPLILSVDMIEYIILEKPKDLSVFSDFLKKEFRDDSESYLTKILYYTQIEKDF